MTNVIEEAQERGEDAASGDVSATAKDGAMLSLGIGIVGAFSYAGWNWVAKPAIGVLQSLKGASENLQETASESTGVDFDFE